MPTYISAEGLKQLEAEMVRRRTTERREIAERIETAKELGDLSENFEYHEAKEAQAMNEARVMELEAMIKDAVIVESQTGGTEVTLGSTFTVEVGGAKKVFEMVGSSEADPMAGKISNESPLGQAFIGRGKGEVVDVQVPSGTVSYKIVSIN